MLNSSPEQLGIPIDNVTIVHGDTDKVQFGMGTYGSRSGAVGMSAIVKALDKVEATKKIAAHLLEAAGDIEFKDGKFSVAGTDKSIGFGDLALQAYVGHKFPTSEIEPGLKEGAFYVPPISPFPPAVTSASWRSTPMRCGDHRPMDRGGRFRHHHQSDDRGRADAWRHRTGRQPGALRACGL